MKISARNQLKGNIQSIKEGAVNASVVLKTDGGEIITSSITIDAVEELELTAGKEVTAIIKATEVLIGIGEFKLSARNQFAGEIVEVKEGAVNAVITLKTNGGSVISSVISIAAAKELGLAPGMKATAIVKATSVMIGA